FSTKDAKGYGIHPSLLTYYHKNGVLDRIAPGFYKVHDAELNVPFEWEDLILTTLSIPNGIICLISALALYELSDQIPRKFWIAIANDRHPPKRQGVRYVRMRNMELGRTTIQLGEFTLPIFDKERTVVDSFRHLSIEIAIKSLQDYLKQDNPDFNKLSEYAQKLRTHIQPYILSLTT
ncbi:MAG: hypothetical protein HY391_00720, partial [Deltaproteobacteria bacterium]|nr:hypothetical protein [Deltaproteobacteria bacterium]